MSSVVGECEEQLGLIRGLGFTPSASLRAVVVVVVVVSYRIYRIVLPFRSARNVRVASLPLALIFFPLFARSQSRKILLRDPDSRDVVVVVLSWASLADFSSLFSLRFLSS